MRLTAVHAQEAAIRARRAVRERIEEEELAAERARVEAAAKGFFGI
jgi:hypothetical protein